MATEANAEVSGPTNQPLIIKESVSEELNLESLVDEKSDVINPTDEIPKISKESRHSIGSYSVTNKQKVAGTSSSLGVGSRFNVGSHMENTMAKSQSEIQVCTTNSLSVSQTSKNSLMTYSSSGTFYDHSTTKKNPSIRIMPKPAQQSFAKDPTDFRQMEQGLLQLLEDFHSGKLEAFGQNCTYEKMENVREQQETLARLHFDLNAEQELCGQHTDEGIKMAKGNLSKLMENLQKLSLSILSEQLQSGTLGAEGDT